MDAMLKELINYQELLFAFTRRNIQMKYKQTSMGVLWAIFMPIIIIFSGVIVRKAMAVLAGAPLTSQEISSVAVKSLPWAFFVTALRFAVGSLVGNMHLVTKIYFPRIIFPLSYVLGQSLDFLEREARNRLNLIKPGERMVILPQNNSTDVETETKVEEKGKPLEKPRPNWQKWWELLF